MNNEPNSALNSALDHLASLVDDHGVVTDDTFHERLLEADEFLEDAPLAIYSMHRRATRRRWTSIASSDGRSRAHPN